MDKSRIIYHKNCSDGFLAALLLRNWLILESQAQDITCTPANYGDDPPDVTGEYVYIADFSYKRQAMLNLQVQAKVLRCFDHHETAEKELDGLEFCVFDQERSGAGIVYKWLTDKGFDCAEYETLVSYVEDRDLWKWQLPNSRAISAYLQTLPWDFDVWELAASHLSDKGLFPVLVGKGETVLHAQEKAIETHLEHAWKVKPSWLDGLWLPVCNCSMAEITSELGHRLALDALCKCSLTFRFDKGKLVFSLRSTLDGPDVSVFAGMYGGGGHKHAAGFKAESWPF